MKARVAALLLATVLGSAWVATGCRGGDSDIEPLSPLDSAATTREVAASLAGYVASGSQSYTFRELYAGMRRAELERRARAEPSPPPECAADTTRGAPARQERCSFDTRFRRDSAPAHVEVVYVPERGGELARDITVSRQLPLDVNGLRLARALADAFERQTSVLDRRDESFDRSSAHIRVGSTSAARQNFAEVSVEMKGGRELLTVRLARIPRADHD